MSRSKSSSRWLQEHHSDPYVQQAQKQGYRSRAVFKLKEIQEKYRILKPGMVVVDLGAAPGGWSQVATEYMGGKGKIFALDILEMSPLPGVDFVQGDFLQPEVFQQLLQLAGRQVDLVMSDMAPNLSGNPAIDQPRAMTMAENAAYFAEQVLTPKGALLVKLFHGEGFDSLVKQLRGQYQQVKIIKPKASRPRSREVYLYAKGQRGQV